MRVKRFIDALLALLVAIGTGLRLSPRRRLPRDRSERNLLVIDSSYDLAALESRGALSVVTSRDLDGYFDRVWSAHPIVGASPAHRGGSRGLPRIVRLNARHTFIEGHITWDGEGSRWPILSLARAQSAVVRELDEIMSGHGVSVVQASDPYYPGLLGLMLARRHRAAFAVRVSGNYDAIFEAVGLLAYPRLIPSRRIERRMARFVLKRTVLVLPANKNNQEFAIANGARRERCVLVPAYGNVLNAAHLSEPSIRSGAVDLPQKPFLLMISRLERVKHPEDAIEVLALLREKGHDLSLVLAGDGSLRSELQGLANRLNVASDVIFMGDRSQDWIADAAAKAVAILSPLAGRALVEALLGGRPVIAYAVEWHGEMITDGVDGFLVPYRDLNAMADTAERLLSDSILATKIGRMGRRHALAAIDPERMRVIQREAYGAAIARTKMSGSAGRA